MNTLSAARRDVLQPFAESAELWRASQLGGLVGAHSASMRRRRQPNTGKRATIRVGILARDTAMRMAAATAFDAAPPEWAVDLYTDRPTDCDVVLVCPDVAETVPGAIPFDPAQPAEALAAIAARVSARRLPTIMVTGAGRGAGVTSLALHLSAAMAPHAAVCYVDLDRRWGAAARLGLDQGALKTWGSFDGSLQSLKACALPVRGGFRALFSPLSENCLGREPQASLDEGVLLAQARAGFEVVVADVPSSGVLERIAKQCEVGVLVLAPARPAAVRARFLLERWPDLNWLPVTNRSGPGGETTRAELQSIIGRSIRLELPCAPSLRDAEDDGRLLSSRLSPWARRVDRLARALRSL